MSIRGGLQVFGLLGLGKAWNEEDHPRDDDGKFSSAGGGGSGGDEDDDGYGPGEGYEPKDQERHDKAMASLNEHVGNLEGSLNRVAAAVHGPDVTSAQIVAAGKDAVKHFKEAGRAYDKMQAVRDRYGDEAHDVPIFNLDTEDLIGALKNYENAHVASQEALTTIRENTASRAAAVAQAVAGRHDDAITQLERELEAASSSMAARRAAMRSTFT